MMGCDLVENLSQFVIEKDGNRKRFPTSGQLLDQISTLAFECMNKKIFLLH